MFLFGIDALINFKEFTHKVMKYLALNLARGFYILDKTSCITAAVYSLSSVLCQKKMQTIIILFRHIPNMSQSTSERSIEIVW